MFGKSATPAKKFQNNLHIPPRLRLACGLGGRGIWRVGGFGEGGVRGGVAYG